MKYSYKKGFTLILSVVISGLVLSIGMAVARIATRQIMLSSVQRDSQMAFFAADTGIECARFWSDFSSTPNNPKCNKKNLKIGSLDITDFSTVEGKQFWFNFGGQRYVDANGDNKDAGELCVRVDVFADKFQARGYNVSCDNQGIPRAGRVVERKLVFRYL